jgi:hypothetical protein
MSEPYTCKRCGIHDFQVIYRSGNWRQFGSLDEEHRWEFEDSEWADDEGSADCDEFYVHCAGCAREIEFGWSRPDRQGRIWPVEAGDFNPSQTWPEARYKDAWAERNWLGPAGDVYGVKVGPG